MAFAAKLFSDDRGAERYAIRVDATLRDTGRNPLDVVVEDLSVSGFRIATSASLEIGATITLGVAGLGVRAATIVREQDGWYGCAFATAADGGDIARVLGGVETTPLPFAAARDDRGAIAGAAAWHVEPSGERYSGAVRLGMLLTLSIASWAVAGTAIHAIL